MSILDTIVERRRTLLKEFGPTLGFDIPKERTRKIVPFLQNAGTVLEIKRASPSKGDIAPDLDPVELAKTYAAAGTMGISVLTESDYFKGSLKDLIAVANAVPECAILRKDFLLEEEEIDIAYLCGADAVLLIARILPTEKLLSMAKKAASLGLTPFVEIRTEEDLQKLKTVLAEVNVVAGVNSRDLKTFTLDALVPASVRSKIPCPCIFESGIHSNAEAIFAKNLGFEGILVGEYAAKNPEKTQALVKSFVNAQTSARGNFWKIIAEKIKEKKGKPLVKICGNTRFEDVLLATKCGADLIGFIFAESKRKVSLELVREIKNRLKNECEKIPLCVGVITDENSQSAKEAFQLVQEGVLDCIQYHGILAPAFEKDETLPVYNCFSVAKEDDLSAVEKVENPRFLLDAKVEGLPGGTGTRVPQNILLKAKEMAPLWIAGGITPENVHEIIATYSPELIDTASGVECAPSQKDTQKLIQFFKEINHES